MRDASCRLATAETPAASDRGFVIVTFLGPPLLSDQSPQPYFELKSRNHQPSSHSRLTLRQPSGTCGYG